MADVWRYIFANSRTFSCHNAGFALLSFASYASGAWVPEFFRRSFQWEISKTGLIYGATVAIFGSLGIVSAGRIADWMRGKGTAHANMKLGLTIALVSVPVHLLVYLAPAANWA